MSETNFDTNSTEIKPAINSSLTVDGVKNPTSVSLGKKVEILFESSSNLGEFYVNDCTAKGLEYDKTVILKKF